MSLAILLYVFVSQETGGGTEGCETEGYYIVVVYYENVERSSGFWIERQLFFYPAPPPGSRLKALD